jgi:uncharacterized OsmC-like protein
MHISAIINNRAGVNDIIVTTEGVAKSIEIPAKATGNGLAINGGELLLLALAACCCNDIYREAAKRNIIIESVEISATCLFGAEGEPGRGFEYKVQIASPHSAQEIALLIQYVDSIAEVHNTLRKGTAVTLKQ